MKRTIALKYLHLLILLMAIGCQPYSSGQETAQNDEPMPLRLITLDPGHFHAALVQKKMYESLDAQVQVYAPGGDDVEQHLQRIEQYNERETAATHWREVVYLGDDYLQKMEEEKAGDIVVLAGKNDRKIEYIRKSIASGMHVLADKPMIIHSADFVKLEKAFAEAEAQNLVLYDIMTERYQVLNLLQNELMGMEDIFGELQPGRPDKPSIEKQSVHHFYKQVTGKPLVRPAWYFDVKQQGEGIIDVSTHFVDLILWSVFPDKLVPREQISIVQAERSATPITRSQFHKVTQMEQFPNYLQHALDRDSVLQVYSNGSFVFQIDNVYAKVSVRWDYQAPQGGGDTHLSIFRGSHANLVIRQGAAQQFQPVLYVEKNATSPLPDENQMRAALASLESKYPGLELLPVEKGWQIVVPDELKLGHEAHFSEVMEKYLDFVKAGKLPEWEKNTMLAKYWITTKAYEQARSRDSSK